MNDKNVMIIDLAKLFGPSMNDPNIAVTRGYNMAFGAFSKALLQFFKPSLLGALLANCVPKGMDSDDAESRRQAVSSLVQVV